jgi:hypothetical protein
MTVLPLAPSVFTVSAPEPPEDGIAGGASVMLATAKALAAHRAILIVFISAIDLLDITDSGGLSARRLSIHLRNPSY